jgi:hypothetical protein
VTLVVPLEIVIVVMNSNSNKLTIPGLTRGPAQCAVP